MAAATGDFRLVMSHPSLLQADSSAANLRISEGWAPLHFAAREGHSPVVMAILAYAPEVEVDAREGQAEGLTPLMLAAVMGHPFTVYLLVTGGRADLSLRSRGKDARTVAELARDRHQHAIADMLITMQAHYEVRGVSDCLFFSR
jgi:ankyrin repeat protein